MRATGIAILALAACGGPPGKLQPTMGNVEQVFVLAQCVQCHQKGGKADFASFAAGEAHQNLVGQGTYTYADERRTALPGPERDWLVANIDDTQSWERVVPGAPARSWLLVRAHPEAPAKFRYVKSDGSTDTVLFRMPLGKGPLPRAWHQLLGDWVAAGAPK